MPGREIGAIEIADRFSLVEVPESAAETSCRRCAARKIKGRTAAVRRDRGHRERG